MKTIVFFAVLIGLTAAQLPTNCSKCSLTQNLTAQDILGLCSHVTKSLIIFSAATPNAWEARVVQVRDQEQQLT